MAVGGMAVNISLVEQTLGDVHRAYWLRIGVMFDEGTRGSETVLGDAIGVESSESGVSAVEKIDKLLVSDPGEEDGQLYTIAVLSSSVGKLIVSSTDDWVDLSMVSFDIHSPTASSLTLGACCLCRWIPRSITW